MTIGLFIPCYVDQFYPQAAIATLRLLEKLGLTVVVPRRQTCCGQPMANSGFGSLSRGCDNLIMDNFKGVDYIVSPSGSCALHIKEHLHSDKDPGRALDMRHRVFELVEFLTDIMKITSLKAVFAHKVSLHQSCHGLRGLHLSHMSERVEPDFSKPVHLLSMVKGLELVKLNRPDECCGFGGTFCLEQEAVSVKMGKDRVADHTGSGAEYITSSDLSCLMHLEGILRRNSNPVKVIHIAEILNAEH